MTKYIDNDVMLVPEHSSQIYIYILQGRTLAALKLLFEEIMEIFPDEYIHFGADEIGSLPFSSCNFRSKLTSLGPHADMCQNTVYALVHRCT